MYVGVVNNLNNLPFNSITFNICTVLLPKKASLLTISVPMQFIQENAVITTSLCTPSTSTTFPSYHYQPLWQNHFQPFSKITLRSLTNENVTDADPSCLRSVIMKFFIQSPPEIKTIYRYDAQKNVEHFIQTTSRMLIMRPWWFPLLMLKVVNSLLTVFHPGWADEQPIHDILLYCI